MVVIAATILHVTLDHTGTTEETIAAIKDVDRELLLPPVAVSWVRIAASMPVDSISWLKCYARVSGSARLIALIDDLSIDIE